MGRTLRSRLIHGKLPRVTEEALSYVHMEKVWELLEGKFGFNVKEWKKEFHAYYLNPPGISKEQAFAEFGEEFINPILNAALKRKEYHDTWANMLKYIIKTY